jgi:site-specific DNA recombinase
VTGGLDLNTDAGIAMARVMVAMANKQSADTARRVKRKFREMAEEGRPLGTWRPFGWQEDKKTLDPIEADLIRDAVKKILADVRVGGIVADWLDRGVVTPRGNPWQWTNLMGMLRNPRLCGYRSWMTRQLSDKGTVIYEYEIVTRPDGTEVLGQWEKVIDREEWDRLIEKIGTHAKPTGVQGPTGARKYLLSGLVRCGACEAHKKMTGNKSLWNGDKGNFYYSCPGKEQGGCGGNGRSGPPLDDLIRDLVFKVHDQRMVERVVEEPADQAKAAAIESRLADIDELMRELYEGWKAKKVPSGRYFAMSEDLGAEREELSGKRAAATSTAGGRWWPRRSAPGRRLLASVLLALGRPPQ